MSAVAIVLGAAVRPDGTPSPTLRLRVEHGVSLYRDGLVTHLCLTGGRGRHGPPEAEAAADLAVAMGVPAEALIRETTSRNTYENILNAQAVLPAETHRIVLVSNRWHLPRAWLVARLLSIPVRLSGPKGEAGWGTTIRSVLREVPAIPRSAFRVWCGRRR